jgi:hypothetical protein
MTKVHVPEDLERHKQDRELLVWIYVLRFMYHLHTPRQNVFFNKSHLEKVKESGFKYESQFFTFR